MRATRGRPAFVEATADHLTNAACPLCWGGSPPRSNGEQDLKIMRYEKPGCGLIVLEDYALSLAQQLVQGVDVWVNTPRRPVWPAARSDSRSAGF
jgi:hypothetical protein